jgi:hypothetical protein
MPSGQRIRLKNLLQTGVLRYVLAATAGIAGITLIARAWYGPFSFGVGVRSPMNAESILAAALVLLLVFAKPLRDPGTELADALPFRRREWLAIAGLYAATLLAYWPSLSVGFVADDYAHILTVSKADASFVWSLFTVPAADRFFRPLGMISYLIDFQWAAFSPFRWHLAAVLLHGVNTVLVYALCRALGLAAVWALFGAAFFGLHASRPEAVTWVAARFDLVATLFVLVAMLLFLAHARRPSLARLLLVLIATICGLLSKESAYVLPLMLAVIVLFRRDLRNPAAYRAILACGALTTAVFLYRWFLLSGIGGYLNPQGKPTILLINTWLLVKALGLRLWAVLLFPLNWTDPLRLTVKAAISFSIVALILLAVRAKSSNLARLGLVLALVAALPVYHLLLIGPDLEKSRVIYLSSAGFGLFLGAMLQASYRPGYRTLVHAAAIAILCFQIAALWHNLATWDRVSQIHGRACDALAAAVLASRTDVVAVGMPNTQDGVYMLKTGLPECLEIRHGLAAHRLHNVPTMAERARFGRGLPVFVWNDDTERVQRLQY